MCLLLPALTLTLSMCLAAATMTEFIPSQSVQLAETVASLKLAVAALSCAFQDNEKGITNGCPPRTRASLPWRGACFRSAVRASSHRRDQTAEPRQTPGGRRVH